MWALLLLRSRWNDDDVAMDGKPVNEKAKRRADWDFLVTYHEARLTDLLEHVRPALRGMTLVRSMRLGSTR